MPAAYQEDVKFDAGQITIGTGNGQPAMLIAKFSIVGYNYVNVQGYKSNDYSSLLEINISFRPNAGSSDGSYIVGRDTTQINPGNYTKSLNISAYQLNGEFSMYFYQMGPAIYRIWLS